MDACCWVTSAFSNFSEDEGCMVATALDYHSFICSKIIETREIIEIQADEWDDDDDDDQWWLSDDAVAQCSVTSSREIDKLGRGKISSGKTVDF